MYISHRIKLPFKLISIMGFLFGYSIIQLNCQNYLNRTDDLVFYSNAIKSYYEINMSKYIFVIYNISYRFACSMSLKSRGFQRFS